MTWLAAGTQDPDEKYIVKDVPVHMISKGTHRTVCMGMFMEAGCTDKAYLLTPQPLMSEHPRHGIVLKPAACEAADAEIDAQQQLILAMRPLTGGWSITICKALTNSFL